MLAWSSLAEREQKWNTFMSDPEWVSARAESEKSGVIVSRIRSEILQAAPFSSAK